MYFSKSFELKICHNFLQKSTDHGDMNAYTNIFFLFLAPEIQHKSECSSASDMFSLGMLMISAFNGGQSIIQANHSTNLYFKQAGLVST